MSGHTDPRLVTKIALRNYKSIAACDVYPGAPVVSRGPEWLWQEQLPRCLTLRGRGAALLARSRAARPWRHSGGTETLRGPSQSLRHSPRSSAPSDATGWYAFRVAAKPGGRYSVQQEECFVVGEGGHGSYRVADGKVEASTICNPPACASDRLYLVNMSGFDVYPPAL